MHFPADLVGSQRTKCATLMVMEGSLSTKQDAVSVGANLLGKRSKLPSSKLVTFCQSW